MTQISSDKAKFLSSELMLRLIPMMLVLLGFALVGPILLNAYWTKTFTSVACLIMASASVALLFGQLGMVSLCQFAIAGFGGWISLRLMHGWGFSFELALLFGGLAASVAGLLTGLPALRMRGLYLALVSLMVAAAFQVVINVTGFPDGGTGWLGKIVNGQRVLVERPWVAQSDTAYLRFTLVIVAASLALIEWHRASMPGRAWALIRKGEAAATAAGVHVIAYKVWAFALAGFLAGISGGLLAGSNGQLDSTGFSVAQSILLFALTIVGGAYHWTGTILAALLLRALPGVLTDSGVDGNLANVFFGFALIFSLVQGRKGMAGQLADVYKFMPISKIVEGVIVWVLVAFATSLIFSSFNFVEFWGAVFIALIALVLRGVIPGICTTLLNSFNLAERARLVDVYITNYLSAAVATAQFAYEPLFFKRFLNWLLIAVLVALVSWGVFDMSYVVAFSIVWLALAINFLLNTLKYPYRELLRQRIDLRFPKLIPSNSWTTGHD
jgi:branched-chain amino acid transport system permease protein